MNQDLAAQNGEVLPRAGRRPSWKWLVRLALGLLIIGVLLQQQDGAEVRHLLRTVSWQVLLLSVVAYWISQILSAWRWQLLLNTLLRRDAHLSLRECCRLYLAGMFWNLWMPTNIGGDAVRAYLASRRCGSMSLAASSIFVERLTGFLALLGIGLIGLIIGATGAVQKTEALHLIAQAVGLLLLCFGALFVVRGLAFRLEARRPEHPLTRKWAGLHRALDLYAQRKRRPALVIALFLSLIFQCSQVVLNIGLARAVGLDLPGQVFLWLVPLLAVASMLPLGIGGLGVREAAAVGLLSGTGASSGTIIAWSLLWQATVWLASLPGAFVATGQQKTHGQ